VTFDKAHRAIKTGDLISLRRELDRGMNANLSNKFSWTLLMLAGTTGNTRIGELLIERGANLDKMNDFGETALSLATHEGRVPFVKLLLAKGASLECQPHGHDLEDWLRNASGLPLDKLASILRIIEHYRRNPCKGSRAKKGA
jgi:ankyrin repeat protein